MAIKETWAPHRYWSNTFHAVRGSRVALCGVVIGGIIPHHRSVPKGGRACATCVSLGGTPR